MTAETIQTADGRSKSRAAAARERLSCRPAALVGAAIVILESAIALLGGHFPVLSLAVLLLAPGLALLPLLPRESRDHWLASLALAPALSFAAMSVVLITVAAVGIDLTGTSVRVMAALVIAAGLALPGSEPAIRFDRAATLTAAGMAAALAIGVVLQDRVLGGSPVPGNDWAKYVLYADEIRAHGGLLIDNPFWLLGVPFREDPGVPSIVGSYLTLTGQPAAVLMHSIWAFAVISILTMFGFVRSLWGPIAGVLAAGIVAALPMSQDILGWHGLANTAALALMPLLLLQFAVMLRRELSRCEAAGAGLVIVALAATHRLSIVVALAAGAAALLVALAFVDRRVLLRNIVYVAVGALVLCPGVAYDLIDRQRTFGGTQDYTAYLSQKVDLDLVARDLTYPFTVVALFALAGAAFLVIRRRDTSDQLFALLPLGAVLLVTGLLAYAWVVHLPVAYLRMAYYLPIALVPLVAAVLVLLLRRLAVPAGLVLVAVIAVIAWDQAKNVHDFYSFARPASIRGLDFLDARLEPGEPVVTDRCWSFLSTWLLHRPTLSALEPADIQPKAELGQARKAQTILRGTPEGRRLARELGIRYAILDPTCSDAGGRWLRPPSFMEPLYVSERLVVLRLTPSS